MDFLTGEIGEWQSLENTECPPFLRVGESLLGELNRLDLLGFGVTLQTFGN
jgi:hypothetical protein